jgi:hypothetical protein
MAEKKLVFREQEAKGSSNTTYIKAKDLAESGKTGVIAEGIFVGTLPNQFDENKPNIKIELAKPDASGNKEVIINAAGNLNTRFRDVSVGTPVQVHYLGMEKITGSKNPKVNGKMSHQFKVLLGE